MRPVDLQRGHDEGGRLDVDSGAAREQAIGLRLEELGCGCADARTDRTDTLRETSERCDGVADLAEDLAPAAVAGPRGCLQQRHAVLASERHALAGLPGIAGGAHRACRERGERRVLSLADARHQGEVVADGVFFPQPRSRSARLLKSDPGSASRRRGIDRWAKASICAGSRIRCMGHRFAEPGPMMLPGPARCHGAARSWRAPSPSPRSQRRCAR